MRDGYVLPEALILANGRSVAVDSLDLSIRGDELLALLGPLGCVKTTTMRAAAGLLEPRSGRILIDTADVTRTHAHRRNAGLVFRHTRSLRIFPCSKTRR